jgi:hypothetical protein
VVARPPATVTRVTRRSPLFLLLPIGLALAAAVAGCSSSAQGGPDTSTASSTPSTSVASSAPVSTVSVTTTIRSTITRTQSASVSTIGPPPSTNEPAAVDGTCPYLTTDWIAYTTGQRQGSTKVIATKPYPVCEFYRSDGKWAATVRIIQADSPASAIAAVNQHVPVEGSQPASQPQGWTGGLISEGAQTADADGKSTYAVSKDKVAVVAEENESRSIKARTIAVCAIFGAKLQTGTAPDYCTTGY